ncbi:MAG TPA: hypothetical protein VF788_13335 [Pseudonocardiaceae bacterium]
MDREVRKLSIKKGRTEEPLFQKAPWLSSGVPRRVFVKGMQGVDVTLMVTVVQDSVWLSISPPFTWEAIMESGKVDELVHVLELARDEAAKTPIAPNDSSSHTGKASVRAITGSSES